MQGPYADLYSGDALARMQLRTDTVLDDDGQVTLKVQCSVAHYVNRAACINLSGFDQRQWSFDTTRIQRYVRYTYDAKARFVTSTRVPFYQRTGNHTNEAIAEQTGIDASGNLNRTAMGDALSAINAHGVMNEARYGSLGRAYFSRSQTGGFVYTTYTWCSEAVVPALPDGTPGIPSGAPRANCPLGAVYRVMQASLSASTSTQIAPIEYAYFDSLGREVLKTTQVYQSNERDSSGLHRWSSGQTRYDILGRARAQSQPYFSYHPNGATRAGTPLMLSQQVYANTQFDMLSRSKQSNIPAEPENAPSQVRSNYNRLATEQTNPRGYVIQQQKNGLGEVTQSTDAAGFSVTSEYAAHGEVTAVARTPSDGSNAGQTLITQMIYDALGRKVAMNDPDKGLISYRYNALGELTQQTDAKGQVQSLYYDALGRIYHKEQTRYAAADSPLGTGHAIDFEFDTAPLGSTGRLALGQLATSSLANGNYVKNIDYDSLGRTVQLRTQMDGQTFYQRVIFDIYGRITQSIDASSNPLSPYGTQTDYSLEGYPIQTREISSGQIYQTVLETNARGQVTVERLHDSRNLTITKNYDHNSGRLLQINAGTDAGSELQSLIYAYNKHGNVISKQNRAGSGISRYDMQEDYTYDAQDRLTQVFASRINGVTRSIGSVADPRDLNIQYDQLGNITQKSGIGYQYKNTPGETGCTSTAGPHALSRYGNKFYCFDANGNNTQVRQDGQVIRSITYTGDDLAERIVRNEGAIQANVEFRYGPDRSRYKRIDNTTGSAASACTPSSDLIYCSGFEDAGLSTAASITYYLGNVEVIQQAGLTTIKRNIGGYLVVTTTEASGIVTSGPTYDYLLRDGIGSVDVIVNERAQIQQRLSFDAYGNRRVADPPGTFNLHAVISPYIAASFDNSRTRRGYTGHEQLDTLGLIHMNGRLYDPQIGRFIQADPLIEQDATQGLNRYSYVLNNPLSLTDPSGYLSFRQALGLAVGITFSWFSAGAGTPFISFLWATSGGFLSAVIATGSIKAGGWAALSAAVFWGIGQGFGVLKVGNSNVATLRSGLTTGQTAAKIAAHAGAGGVLAELQGGKFGSGFLSAGVTQALSPAVGQIEGRGPAAITARTLVSATIGGTVSEISGGSFANGAVTGAFQQLYSETVSAARADMAMNQRMAEAAKFNSDAAIAYESLATHYQEQMQRDYLAGRIDESDLNDFNQAQGAGAAVGAIGGTGILFFGAEAAVATITVSRWGRPGLQAGDWVMKGSASRMNYYLSGKAWSGPGNIPAAFTTGGQFSVAASSVRYPIPPPGTPWRIAEIISSPIKWIMGQRMYFP